MFCKQCGKELEDNAKFCDSCGKSQQISSVQLNTESVNTVLNDNRNIIKIFFTKNPVASIREATNNQSKSGIALIVITVLLFAFVSCLNITQVVNYIIKATTSAINSTANSMFGGVFGNMVTRQAIPNMKAPILLDLFVPLVLFASVVTVAVFAGIYIIFKFKKATYKKFSIIANVVGVSSLPISIALVVNLLLGFIFPQFTIFVFTAAILISLVMLYEGFQDIFNTENPPIIEFTILMLVICMVLAIVSQIALTQIGKAAQDAVMNAAGDSLGGVLSSLW